MKYYYRVHLLDGRTIDFEDYEYMRSFWMTHSEQGMFSHVEVRDPKPKKKSTKGFG